MDTFLPMNSTLKRSQTLTIATTGGASSKFDKLTSSKQQHAIISYQTSNMMSDETTNSGSLSSSSSSTSSSISSDESATPSLIYANNKLLLNAVPLPPPPMPPQIPSQTSGSSTIARSNSFLLGHQSKRHTQTEPASAAGGGTLDRTAGQYLQRRGSMNAGSTFTHQNNTKRRENEISAMLYNAEFNNLTKPMPPSRTSSLRYKVHDPPRPISSVYSNMMNTNGNNNSNNNNKNQQQHYQSYRVPSSLSSSSSSASSCNNDDRNSIYSAFNLNSSNQNNKNYLELLPEETLNEAANEHINGNSNIYAATIGTSLLTKLDEFKIESLYRSIGSHVYSSKCTAKLYTTNLKNLIQLIDWKLEVNGCIPLWVFNTGLNLKRPKCLNLFLVEKRSGFSAWSLSQITYANDFKWSKPGHITFRIDVNESKKSSEGRKAAAAAFKKNSKKLSADSSSNSGDLSSNCGGGTSGSFHFGVLKFDDDFECAQFYDFFRNLFVDTQNDDLFNPHFKPCPVSNSSRKIVNLSGSLSSSAISTSSTSGSSSTTANTGNSATSMLKCLYKKITKAAISSPVAFNHINSLPAVNEDESKSSGGEDSVSIHRQMYLFSPDTQSISSDLTVTSHTNSLIYMPTSRMKQ